MKPYAISILITTILLVVLTVLVSINKNIPLAFLIFSISPILIIIMVYLTLKDKGYKVRDLKENEEWAYRDRDFQP